MSDLIEKAEAVAPCPFCTEGKSVGTYFDHEQGDKWGYASCDACSARGPEVRTSYDRDDNAPWRAEAIAAWNRRAALEPAPTAAEVREAALREAAAVVLPSDDLVWSGSWYEPALRAAQKRILALIGEKPADPQQARFLPVCECGMTGPCMWDQCKHPLTREARAMEGRDG